MANIPTDAAADDLKAMGLPTAFTLDDLTATGFTKAEIAALSEGDDPLIDPATLPEDVRAAAIRGKSAYEEVFEPEDGEEGDEGEGEGDTDGDDGDTDAGNDDQDADAGDTDAGATDTTPDPVLALKDTADLEAKVSGFDDQIEALQTQYDDAELTRAEFNAKLKEITAAQAKATVELERAREANEAATADYRKTWFTKVQTFTAARPELMDQAPIPGLFNDQGQPISAYTAFDSALRYITGTDEGKAKYGALPMAEKIRIAGDMVDGYVQQVTGKPIPGKSAAPAPKKDAKKAEEPGPRKDPRPKAPTTLGGAIAASENEVDESRFAAIDKLDGLEYERAIARLAPEDRKRYLQGA